MYASTAYTAAAVLFCVDAARSLVTRANDPQHSESRESLLDQHANVGMAQTAATGGGAVAPLIDSDTGSSSSRSSSNSNARTEILAILLCLFLLLVSISEIMYVQVIPSENDTRFMSQMTGVAETMTAVANDDFVRGQVPCILRSYYCRAHRRHHSNVWKHSVHAHVRHTLATRRTFRKYSKLWIVKRGSLPRQCLETLLWCVVKVTRAAYKSPPVRYFPTSMSDSRSHFICFTRSSSCRARRCVTAHSAYPCLPAWPTHAMHTSRGHHQLSAPVARSIPLTIAISTRIACSVAGALWLTGKRFSSREFGA